LVYEFYLRNLLSCPSTEKLFLAASLGSTSWNGCNTSHVSLFASAMTQLDRPKPALKGSQSARWLAAIATLSITAVIAALVSQHAFDMQPCPWCVLQRAIFVAIALVCLGGLLWRAAAGQMLSASSVLLLSGSGVSAAAWQHFVAAKSTSCNLTMADKIVTALKLDALLPYVFSATASCADAAADLLGIPYDFWSMGVFLVLALMGLRHLLDV
jgi:protein dithiol:quinone oxidoreductase